MSLSPPITRPPLAERVPLAEPRWFVVHTGARQEERACTSLHRLGYYVILPHERHRKRRKTNVSERRRWMEEVAWMSHRRNLAPPQHVLVDVVVPYYPRYILLALRFADEDLSRVNANDAPGVATLVRSPFTGAPLRLSNKIADQLIEGRLMRSEHNPDARRSPKGFVWMLMRKVELDGDSTSILFTNRRRRLQSDVLDGDKRDGDKRHGDKSDAEKRHGDKRKVAKRA